MNTSISRVFINVFAFDAVFGVEPVRAWYEMILYSSFPTRFQTVAVEGFPRDVEVSDNKLLDENIYPKRAFSWSFTVNQCNDIVCNWIRRNTISKLLGKALQERIHRMNASLMLHIPPLLFQPREISPLQISETTIICSITNVKFV